MRNASLVPTPFAHFSPAPTRSHTVQGAVQGPATAPPSGGLNPRGMLFARPGHTEALGRSRGRAFAASEPGLHVTDLGSEQMQGQSVLPPHTYHTYHTVEMIPPPDTIHAAKGTLGLIVTENGLVHLVTSTVFPIGTCNCNSPHTGGSCVRCSNERAVLLLPKRNAGRQSVMVFSTPAGRQVYGQAQQVCVAASRFIPLER